MLPGILLRTALVTSSILMIIATSEVLSWVLTVGQLPQAAALDRRAAPEPARIVPAAQCVPAAWRHFIEPLPAS
jgi:hypothetical protein